MNNEPVAWMTFDGEYSYDLMLVEDNEDYRNEYIKRNGEKYKDWVQPLYTHPAKTLTKSEFENIVDACDVSGDYDVQYDFSKMFKLVNEAILKSE